MSGLTDTLQLYAAGAMAVVGTCGVVWAWLAERKRRDNGLHVVQGISGPVKLRWPNGAFPLVVWMDPVAPARVQIAFNLAADRLHQVVGKPLFMRPLHPFKMPSELQEGEVMVKAHTTAGTGKAPFHGTTEIDFDGQDGSIQSCVVSVPAPVDNDYYFPVMLHELGHVLGLAHDERTDSIMHPELLSGQELTGGDKALLRRLYG